MLNIDKIRPKFILDRNIWKHESHANKYLHVVFFHSILFDKRF